MSRHVPSGLAALGLALAFVSSGCSGNAGLADFPVGASRTEILEAHGPPAQRQVLAKRSEAVWGPIEDFWQSVPMGSPVEIWTYPVEGGSVELYFVGDSDAVQGKGFAPEGAVFEGSR